MLKPLTNIGSIQILLNKFELYLLNFNLVYIKDGGFWMVLDLLTKFVAWKSKNGKINIYFYKKKPKKSTETTAEINEIREIMSWADHKSENQFLNWLLQII